MAAVSFRAGRRAARAAATALAPVLVAMCIAAPVRGDDSALARFIGSYVGSGTAEVAGSGRPEIRDLDVIIAPYRDDGFTVKWITVVRGRSGDRTDADVRRREVEASFVPLADRPNVYVPATTGGLFQRPEPPDLFAGQPVLWASLDGTTLTVYSIAISPKGGSTLQVYRRTLTDKGMEASFLRFQDDTIEVRMSGELVRAR